jgi:hypothetical protein
MGFDSRLINQVIIRPSEDALEKLYRKQRNIIDDIKQNGLTEELSGKLEDINNKVRVEAKKTNGRLIGVTVDPETLDVSFEGKKAKLGLTDKVLDIKEIAEMSTDKKIKFLTNQVTPRIQAEIYKGFTPNDFKEILSDSIIRCFASSNNIFVSAKSRKINFKSTSLPFTIKLLSFSDFSFQANPISFEAPVKKFICSLGIIISAFSFL